MYLWFLLFFCPVVACISLPERVDELDLKSIELVTKAKSARKLTKELRTELVTFFLDFVQLDDEVINDGDPLLLFKVSRIAARLRNGLRVRLPHVKKRLSKVVSGLLAPLFFPFYFLEEVTSSETTPPVTQPPPVFYPRQFTVPYPRWTPTNFVEVEYPYR